MKSRYRFFTRAPICLCSSFSRPRPKKIWFRWKPDTPVTGLTFTVMICSGVLAATSSISMPPAWLQMMATVAVARSGMMEK